MKKLNSFLVLLLMTSLFYINSAKSQTTVVDIIVNSPDHTTLEAAVICISQDKI